MIEQEASATDTPTPRYTESGFSRIDSNELVLRLSFSSSFASSNVIQERSKGGGGGRGEGEEEGRIRIALRSNVATARPRSPRGEMRERKHRAEGGRGDMFVSDQQERILAQLAHDDAPVDGL